MLNNKKDEKSQIQLMTHKAIQFKIEITDPSTGSNSLEADDWGT